MIKKNVNPVLESIVLKHLRFLPKGKNAKLFELTECVLDEIKPKMKQADAYNVVGRLLTKLKRAGTVKYVGGRSCGWRLS